MLTLGQCLRFRPAPGIPWNTGGRFHPRGSPTLRSRRARIDTLNGTRCGAQTTLRMVRAGQRPRPRCRPELDGVTGGRHALAVNVAVPQSDGVFNRSQAGPAPSIIEGTTMDHYAGIDVSLESSSLCVVDATGRVVREAKIASEPEALTAWLKNLGLEIVRIGLEAGPLSQWLYAGMQQAGLPAELLETRHVRTAFKIMPVKTDRKDARGIAQLMRLGWFRPVHCKSLAAQETRAVLGARKLLQIKLHDIEMSLRGTLRGFGLKVGKTTAEDLREPGPKPGGGASDVAGGQRCVVAGPHGAGGAIQETGQPGPPGRPCRQAGAAADDGARRRIDRRADLCRGDRRSQPVQIVQECGTAVRTDPKTIPVRGDGRNRADLEGWRRDGAHRALRSRQCHSGRASAGDSPLRRWALAVARRAGMRKAKVALARKLAVILHRMLVDGTPFDAAKAAAAA